MAWERFTAEEDARLLDLRKRYPGNAGGRGNKGGIRAIAEIMGRPPGSVQARLMKLMCIPRGSRGHQWRFTPEDDARLLALRAEHPGYVSRKGERGAGTLGLGTIGKIMGRTPAGLRRRLRKLEGLDA